MADKRMFSKQIIDSDAFLDMPLSSQALYFHLNMRADDDGFVNNPRKIQRMICCGEDDLKLLIAKKFVIPFESGVCVIKHWLIHNYIRKDTYKETVYTDEKMMLAMKENKSYTLGGQSGDITSQIRNELVDEKKGDYSKKPLNQVIEPPSRTSNESVDEPSRREDKTRLDKVSIDKTSIDKEGLSAFVHSNIEVFKHFEKCGFMVSPQLMEIIAADIEIYGSQWLIDAATESLERGKINYKYTHGILQNWKAEGRDKKAKDKETNNPIPYEKSIESETFNY